MKAGRELDALIAKEVMGLQNVGINLIQTDNFYRGHWEELLCYSPEPDTVGYQEEVPHYSTDMNDAWKVVEYIRNNIDPLNRMWKPNISHEGEHFMWRCEFKLENDNAGDDTTYYCANAETAPLAICLAAIKTVVVEI